MLDRVRLWWLLIGLTPIPGMAGSPQVTIGNATIDREVAPLVSQLFADDDRRAVRSVSIDLNRDGVPEKFLPNEFLCGNGGCPWLVYDQRKNKLLGNFFGSFVEVMDQRVNGYQVLKAYLSTGGASGECNVYELSGGQYEKRPY